MRATATATDPSTGRSPRRVLVPPTVLAVAAALGTAGLAAWNPHVHHVPLCPLHAATGIWCPLCGGLRAVNDLVTQHWQAAFSDNALVVVLGPLAVVWWFAWMRRAARGRPGGPSLRLAARHRQIVWVGAAVAVLAYTVVRNLPVGAALAPAG